MKNNFYLMTLAILIVAMSAVAQETSSFTDSRDGKTYKTVKIGNQIWMAENLAYKPDSGNYCAYGNNQSNVSKYGYLYDYQTAKKVCPSNWHLPTDADWITLTNYLGGKSVAGGKMKETGTNHWKSPNEGATNQSGFTALPGGYRLFYESFGYIDTYGSWWGSTECYTINAWHRILYYDRDGAHSFEDSNKERAFSVRCVRD